MILVRIETKVEIPDWVNFISWDVAGEVWYYKSQPIKGDKTGDWTNQPWTDFQCENDGILELMHELKGKYLSVEEFKEKYEVKK